MGVLLVVLFCRAPAILLLFSLSLWPDFTIYFTERTATTHLLAPSPNILLDSRLAWIRAVLLFCVPLRVSPACPLIPCLSLRCLPWKDPCKGYLFSRRGKFSRLDRRTSHLDFRGQSVSRSCRGSTRTTILEYRVAETPLVS